MRQSDIGSAFTRLAARFELGRRNIDAGSLVPALLGLAVGLGPAAAALFPPASGLRTLGACVLGGLVAFRACRSR